MFDEVELPENWVGLLPYIIFPSGSNDRRNGKTDIVEYCKHIFMMAFVK